MKVTRRQHHIPRMILKRFLDSSGKILLGNLKNRDILTTDINSVACVSHLYSVDIDGQKDDSLEKKFSLIEAKANSIIDKLISFNSITNEEICRLVGFVVTLFYRSPRIVKLAEKYAGSDNVKQVLLDTFMENGGDVAVAESYFQKLSSQKGFAYSQVFGHVFNERVEVIINNFDVIICRCDGVYPQFILHDNYATFDFLDNPSVLSLGTNIWEANMQIFCPLSKDVCLVFIPKKDNKGHRIFNYSVRYVDQDFMISLNEKFMRQAESFIYGSNCFEIQRLVQI